MAGVERSSVLVVMLLLCTIKRFLDNLISHGFNNTDLGNRCISRPESNFDPVKRVKQIVLQVLAGQ
jgi:hypothetical protein